MMSCVGIVFCFGANETSSLSECISVEAKLEFGLSSLINIVSPSVILM